MASVEILNKLGFNSKEEWQHYLSNSKSGKKIIIPSDEKLKELNIDLKTWKILRKTAMRHERKENNQESDESDDENDGRYNDEESMDRKRYDVIMEKINKSNKRMKKLNKSIKDCKTKISKLITSDEENKRTIAELSKNNEYLTKNNEYLTKNNEYLTNKISNNANQSEKVTRQILEFMLSINNNFALDEPNSDLTVMNFN